MAKSNDETQGTIPVRLAIDLEAVQRYLKEHVAGFPDGKLHARQFDGGMSNPTYLLWSDEAPAKRFVLRKKPPGVLLPSAHQVEREYKVLKALQGSRVPVPKVYCLCEDSSVTGQTFYVMDFVEGRILKDESLPDFTPEERSALWADLTRVLAELHAVDYKAVGLASLGKPTGYVQRQLKTWGRQVHMADALVQKALGSRYDPSKMQRLMQWISHNMPKDDQTCIAHGDFRLGNCIIHPTEPRVVAVLDWEICTVGHPAVDVAWFTAAWDSPATEGRRLVPGDKGTPTKQDLISLYFRCRGRKVWDDSNWHFFVVLNWFRMAAIAHGVYARSLQGNAGSSQAHLFDGYFLGALDTAISLLQPSARL
eukprot:Sspe_Gene.109877::Locus_90107_Transcript_1_1_Confidence_1.000_Length_1225::g.109877::m.109877